ncbi:RecX family transcriptional regulator [Peptoniphilus sp. oral taxon 386]|uniref:RecX family transcriptional regulator n=1 Tax=Peptoniphilus sp. oral taxon 386 TaxID=652713 RepID=UPI0001DA9C67|nr:RecX family transcriptional regulator [Peptoniphilus sp. oral taxon 386]EFI42217.1 putative regulatory protein RecX [Peptoniphilus sp. oral taxon 386 str. F0131]
MIIKNILYNKKSNTFTVNTDTDYNFEILEDTLVKFNLYKSMEINHEIIKNILFENKKYIAINLSLKYIRNLKTEYEIREYLKLNQIETEIIDKTICYLQSMNYIDDLKYAKYYTSDKIRINKHGLQKIRLALSLKGINKNIIDSVFEDADTDTEHKNLLSEIEKKIKYNKTDKNQYEKLLKYLTNKGYSYSKIKLALKEINYK